MLLLAGGQFVLHGSLANYAKRVSASKTDHCFVAEIQRNPLPDSINLSYSKKSSDTKNQRESPVMHMEGTVFANALSTSKESLCQ